MAPEQQGSDKQALTVDQLPVAGLGSSLRNLMKVVQVRTPPPQAAHGVQHRSPLRF
jgi:hypothetical protein